MAKAVLVMDMPECCADCACSYFERDSKCWKAGLVSASGTLERKCSV
jgi:hypothetical protein